MSDRLMFLNLPVRDLPASLRFFEHLGFGFDARFTDQSAACMVVSDKTYVMLVQRDRFRWFAARPVAESRETTAALVGVSAPDRAAVDAFADAALEAGATPAKEPMDHGFMYSRSFHDLDGHHWEAIWMDPAAVEQGPEAYAEAAGI